MRKLVSIFLVLAMLLFCVPVNAVGPELAAGDANLDAAEYQAESGLLSPVILEEDVSRRGEYEKHFLCDDGSFIAIAYSQPVHMLRDGEWTNAELPLVTQGDRVASTNQEAAVSLAKTAGGDGGLVRFNTGKYELSWSVTANYETSEHSIVTQADAVVKTDAERKTQGGEAVKTVDELLEQKEAALEQIGSLDAEAMSAEETLAVEELNGEIEAANQSKILDISCAQTEVEYPGALGSNATLRYILTPGRVKEEIVLSSRNGFVSYTAEFNADGLTAELREDNSILLLDEAGETEAVITAPYMYDAAYELSMDFGVTVEQDGDAITIVYTPDAEWLDDTARAWPVVIDPTATTNRDANYNADNYVDSLSPNTVIPHTGGTLISGWVSGTQEFRSYWKPTIPELAGNKTITNVNFYLRLSTSQAQSNLNGGTVNLNRITGNWSSSTIKWSNRPTFDSTTAASANTLNTVSNMSNWLKFSNSTLTTAVKNWYNGTFTNYGLRITTGLNRLFFYSADNADWMSRPYLSITYTQSDQTAGITTNRMYFIQNELSGYVMDVSNSETAANTPVIQFGKHSAANQKFRLIYVSGGEYKIEPMHMAGMGTSYGKVLGLSSSKKLITTTDTSVSSKRWYIHRRASGVYYIENKAYPGEYLSVNGSAASGADIYSSRDPRGMYWKITAVSRTVNVKVLRHPSFNTTFSNPSGYASELFNKAAPAFFNKWGIKLIPTQQATPANKFSVDSCPIGYFTSCNNSCTKPSAACTGCKHKCGVLFQDEVRVKYPTDSTYGLVTCFYTFDHTDGCFGGGDHSSVWMSNQTNPNHVDYLWNVRRIQHEITHCFGVSNNHDDVNKVCIAKNIERCIYNEGYDDVYTYDQDDLWCSNCQKDFQKEKFN